MIKTLLKGTFILTVTGLITRVIGFLYKIYLSNILGAANLGIYQLVFPIFAIAYTLYVSGIQTAISQMVASKAPGRQSHKAICIRALCISFCFSVSLSLIIYLFAENIALLFLGEIKCAPLIRLLVFAFPLSAISSCVNGYYYGIKKTSVPALSQLIEQLVRVAYVYIMLTIFSSNENPALIHAVIGISAGEGVSMIYSLIMIYRLYHKNKTNNTIQNRNTTGIYKSLFAISAPLTANRLVISLLHTVETTLIPVMLKKYGMSSNDALSIYGILTGMALPFILFPSTITNSLSVLLLPTISEVNNDKKRIQRISGLCIGATVILGIASTIIFVMFGSKIGAVVFNNEMVGNFIKVLAFLCPFLYLSTTLSSIINGMGKTYITFIITITGLALRIFITIKTVPVKGISGYLISLLVSQLLVTCFSYICYKKLILKMHKRT